MEWLREGVPFNGGSIAKRTFTIIEMAIFAMCEHHQVLSTPVTPSIPNGLDLDHNSVTDNQMHTQSCTACVNKSAPNKSKILKILVHS